MPGDPSKPVVDIPLNYPTTAIFIDESGAKATQGEFFVVAAVKVRSPGKFTRKILEIRDRTGFRGEFKFSQVTKGSLAAYYDLINEIENSTDIHIAACVVDRTRHPFKGVEPWQMQAEVTTQLLVGCVNRRELVSIYLDGISTPVDVALDDDIRRRTNKRLGCTKVVGAVALDSKSNDMLQVADLIAGAISHERRQLADRKNSIDSPKGRLVVRLRGALGVENFADQRSKRINIGTFKAPAVDKKPRLKAV